jgi:hypothetical protein
MGTHVVPMGCNWWPCESIAIVCGPRVTEGTRGYQTVPLGAHRGASAPGACLDLCHAKPPTLTPLVLAPPFLCSTEKVG